MGLFVVTHSFQPWRLRSLLRSLLLLKLFQFFSLGNQTQGQNNSSPDTTSNPRFQAHMKSGLLFVGVLILSHGVIQNCRRFPRSDIFVHFANTKIPPNPTSDLKTRLANKNGGNLPGKMLPASFSRPKITTII